MVEEHVTYKNKLAYNLVEECFYDEDFTTDMIKYARMHAIIF